MLICADSVESVHSQVRVSKPAVVLANDVGKQCTTNQTNELVLSPQESTLRSPLTSSPVKESDVIDETETMPTKS